MEVGMQDRDRSRSALRKPRRRVRAACERCRRQKLGCDKVRPCAMCVRSGVECITSAASEARNNQTRRRSAPRPHCASESSAELTQVSRDQRVSVSSVPNIHPPGDERFTLDAEDVRAESERGFSLGHHSYGPSAIDLTRQIFDKFEAGNECENESFALPGGSEASPSHPTHNVDILLRDMIGMDLPPRNVTDYLVDTYLNSVHWFMMVFHEPTFMANYSNIVDSGVVPQRKTGFVVLLMMVLTIGARYSTPQSAREHCPDIDLKALQTSLLSKVKESMFELYDEGRLEAVQTSILLASFYLYHERPNLAFAILGAGIKSAQAMGLHRESSWKCISDISRETRRRTWWALYVFDRFASIVFGRPCSINDADCEVYMVQNLDDTSARHPKFNSLETLGDGTSTPVTIFTYQRFKFNLYRIASPILGNVYFLRGATKSQVINRVGKIHNELLSWFSSLPEELRVGEHQPRSRSDSTPVEITFRLQAVALQLAFDNIMILLHRPLLQYTFDTSAPTATGIQGVVVEQTGDGSSSWTPNTQSISKNQCWESAMRTSRITEHVDILRVMKNTHAAAYTSIHMFTAGVFLSVVALSHPLSSEAQEAKKAIGRVIRLSKALGHRTVLSAQSGNILQSLVRVILSKEMKELLADNVTDTQGGGMLSTACPTPSPPSPVGETNGFSTNDTLNYLPNPRLASAQLHQGNYSNLDPGFGDMYDGRGPFGALGGADFSEGFMSVQKVIRGSNNHIAVDGFSPLQALDNNGQVADGTGQASTAADMNMSANNTGNVESIFGGAYGGLNDSGQYWMWDMDPTLSYFDTCEDE